MPPAAVAVTAWGFCERHAFVMCDHVSTDGVYCGFWAVWFEGATSWLKVGHATS